MARIKHIQDMPDKKKRKKTSMSSIFHWMLEFSKKLTVTLTIFFFLISLYIAIVVNTAPDSTVLSTMTTEFNETFRVCVGGYFCKAGIENAIKIYKNRRVNHNKQNFENSVEGDFGNENH